MRCQFWDWCLTPQIAPTAAPFCILPSAFPHDGPTIFAWLHIIYHNTMGTSLNLFGPGRTSAIGGLPGIGRRPERRATTGQGGAPPRRYLFSTLSLTFQRFRSVLIWIVGHSGTTETRLTDHTGPSQNPEYGTQSHVPGHPFAFRAVHEQRNRDTRISGLVFG